MRCAARSKRAASQVRAVVGHKLSTPRLLTDSARDLEAHMAEADALRRRALIRQTLSCYRIGSQLGPGNTGPTYKTTVGQCVTRKRVAMLPTTLRSARRTGRSSPCRKVGGEAARRLARHRTLDA